MKSQKTKNERKLVNAVSCDRTCEDHLPYLQVTENAKYCLRLQLHLIIVCGCVWFMQHEMWGKEEKKRKVEFRRRVFPRPGPIQQESRIDTPTANLQRANATGMREFPRL
jgi:hypothetical protein